MIIPLLKGLAFTLGRFFSRPITIQYPEEKVPPANAGEESSILRRMNRES